MFNIPFGLLQVQMQLALEQSFFGQVEKQLPHKSGALSLTIDVLYREAAFWKPEASCGSDNDDSVALAVHLLEVNV
ncbi:hypothetical protein CMV_014753 [Castanea mollissima]|uniref:Uncharacterized protein n=1 Tax=Castanea mollissima TaxID=60419 RepID=A0A8J4QX86_9ROSI|nr:hypothetical protein CMV_014753 [Castanea mollissima]